MADTSEYTNKRERHNAKKVTRHPIYQKVREDREQLRQKLLALRNEKKKVDEKVMQLSSELSAANEKIEQLEKEQEAVEEEGEGE